MLKEPVKLKTQNNSLCLDAKRTCDIDDGKCKTTCADTKLLFCWSFFFLSFESFKRDLSLLETAYMPSALGRVFAECI